MELLLYFSTGNGKLQFTLVSFPLLRWWHGDFILFQRELVLNLTCFQFLKHQVYKGFSVLFLAHLNIGLHMQIRLTEAQQQKTPQQDMKPEQLEKLAKLEGWRQELKLLEDKKAELAAL